MYEEICYEEPFLREVIAKIDFVAPLEGLEKALSPKLARALSEHFPISEPIDAIAREFQLNGVGVQQRETRFKQWNFFGKEREKQLALAPPSVFVTYKRYPTFETMKPEVAAILEAVEKAFPDAKAGRFGLRYINSIEIQNLAGPTTWGEYITAELLGTTNFFPHLEQLTRLIHIAELKYGDMDVRFQFGMPNPDYPAMMKRPQFILDLDAYVQTAHDLRDSLEYMQQAHETIQDLFERSITEKLREIMHARPAVRVQE